MNANQKQALTYIQNTGGCATKAQFVEDHEPIGNLLWNDVNIPRWVEIDAAGKIQLTEAGKKALKENI